ncbi:hypothetical protein [uncultured Cytophaga sp.]|uniref:hypothetical protein n=1 Tax=uncultured Cytophaga sp. TaxID=160238 RepID=UPI002635379D|nr:hypothetical protein [uncultured Cytophaga sp.]
MTKVFTLLSLAAVLAFASCAEKKVEVSNEDTLTVVPTEVAPVAPDTTTMAPDTTTTTTTTEVVK